jgi:hypothetical protein
MTGLTLDDGNKPPENEAGRRSEERDSWSRFERAVDAAIKSGPMHRSAPSKVDAEARKPDKTSQTEHKKPAK